MKNNDVREVSVILPELKAALTSYNSARFDYDKADTFDSVSTSAASARDTLDQLLGEYSKSAVRAAVASASTPLAFLRMRYVSVYRVNEEDEEGNPCRGELEEKNRELTLSDCKGNLEDGFLAEVVAVARLSAYVAAKARAITGADQWLTRANNGKTLPKAVLDKINGYGGKKVTMGALKAALHALVLKLSGGELSLGKAAHYVHDFGNVVIRMSNKDCTVRELVSDTTIYRAFASYVLAVADKRDMWVNIPEDTTEEAEEAAEE